MEGELPRMGIERGHRCGRETAEASRYLKVAAATLRSWVVGRPYPVSEGVGQVEPLIHPPQVQPPTLSFWNLIEVGRPVVLRAGVSTAAIVDRIDAGEEIEALADDYELSPHEITQAVFYERAAVGSISPIAIWANGFPKFSAQAGWACAGMATSFCRTVPMSLAGRGR